MGASNDLLFDGGGSFAGLVMWVGSTTHSLRLREAAEML